MNEAWKECEQYIEQRDKAYVVNALFEVIYLLGLNPRIPSYYFQMRYVTTWGNNGNY